MPYREWVERIRDILAAIARIQRRTTNITFEAFAANDTIVNACLYDLIIIGEAAINIPPEVQNRYPQVFWLFMGDMRNIIAHEYFQVKLDMVWNTIQNYLPPLIGELEEISDREMSNES